MKRVMKRMRWLTALLIGALVAAACTGGATTAPAASTSGEPASTNADTADSSRCGDRSQLSDSLSFYNWSDYIDPEVFTMFEEECGVKVVEDTFSSNEDLLAKLQAGATGYDVIVPSDYMVSIMIELGLLKELDHANIPNIANLSETFSDPPYDPGNRYSVPYQWGTSGIGYDLEQVGEVPTSLAVFFDPEQIQQFSGKVSMLNDGREVIGAALKYLGYSLNSTDPAQIEEAKQLILAIKPHIAIFDSDTFGDLLVSGEAVIGLGWSGGYYQSIFDNEDRQLGYSIPVEGDTLWTDNLAIPVSAPNPYTAEVFINYLLDAEIGAMITNFTYYGSPNQAAEPLILDEIKENPSIYPPQEVLDRMEFIVDVGEATQLYERTWTEIKSE